MEKLLISVIIPIYNREEYLDECINSIVNQTIFNQIELILINDGSFDRSEEICLEYCKKYSNIKYFYQDNQGVSISRNNGLKKAIGDYIYFMDSDDTICNDFLEVAYNNAVKNNSDIVIVGTNCSIRTIILKSNQIPAYTTWQGFYKSSFINKINIKFKEKMSCAEDILFSSIVIPKAQKITKEEKAFYNYRNTENSLVKVENYGKNFVNIRKQLTSEMIKILNKEPYNDLLKNNNLKIICEYIFYRIFIQKNLNIKDKFNLFEIIHNYLFCTKSNIIKFNPLIFHWRYSLLYSFFNVVFIPSFIVGFLRNEK